MASPLSAPPLRMVEREVVVTATIPEAQGAVTIKMKPLDAPEYVAGQFISIDPKQFPELERWVAYLQKQKGRREPRRTYSLSSAPFEEGIAITVKAESYDPDHEPYPPLLSPFLVDHLAPGRALKIMGYSGRYCMEGCVPEDVNTLVHLCAGSGIVPNFAMIKQDLRMGHRRHVLLYSNKTHEDIIFRAQLESLHHHFPERLEVFHYLTRESEAGDYGPNYFGGRISGEVIQRHAPRLQEACVYVCGPAIGPRERRAAKKEGRVLPPRFLESMIEALETLEVDKERINKESWG